MEPHTRKMCNCRLQHSIGQDGWLLHTIMQSWQGAVVCTIIVHSSRPTNNRASVRMRVVGDVWAMHGYVPVGCVLPGQQPIPPLQQTATAIAVGCCAVLCYLRPPALVPHSSAGHHAGFASRQACRQFVVKCGLACTSEQYTLCMDSVCVWAERVLMPAEPYMQVVCQFCVI